MKRSSLFLVLLTLLISATITAEPVSEKAVTKRNQLILALRDIRPMVYNFPCDPLPECLPQDTAEKEKSPGQNIDRYQDVKRIYQEGLIYLFEDNFINSYSRFLDAQLRMDKLLEKISQQYIDRAESMLRASIEKKNPNDERDASVVDISIDYGPNSKLRRDFDIDREIPIDVRRYDPRTHHYAVNKYRIEKNMEKGYERLGLAKEVRMKALKLDQNLRPGEALSARDLSKRIDFYIASIKLAREAKLNAEFIFALKYPYDNYPIQNPTGKTEKVEGKPEAEIPSLHGVKMNWSKNPHAVLGKLNPIFDFRVPQEWHRDTVDARNRRFDDEVDVNLRFKYHGTEKPVEILEDKNNPEGGQ